MAQVGRSIPRIEARPKVTGGAEYTQQLRLPGMLHGKIFRSTIAHGRIRNIDARAARRISGVHCVITIEDILKLIPDPYYGPALSTWRSKLLRSYLRSMTIFPPYSMKRRR